VSCGGLRAETANDLDCDIDCDLGDDTDDHFFLFKDAISDKNLGAKITLNDVLFFQNDNSEITFGSPSINGAKVEAEIVKTYNPLAGFPVDYLFINRC
jgi:hypothetical protein